MANSVEIINKLEQFGKLHYTLLIKNEEGVELGCVVQKIAAENQDLLQDADYLEDLLANAEESLNQSFTANIVEINE